ncbi:MAG: tail fiber domain-containing protein [Ignavibacteriae bacterium]|nr:tail fiber domain-containing protein [Ignavibacteriota bacterium]
MKRYFILILLTIMQISLYSQVPNTLSWQGIVQDNNGANLDGQFNITTRLFDVSSGGTALWTETQNNVQISDGLANLTLGEITPLTISFNNQLWLEIQVGAGTPLPRIKLTSVPYALHSASSVTYTEGAGINISGNTISAALGTSISTGELDDLAVANDKIANATITSAKLSSMGATNGNLLGYNGTAWGPVAKNTVSPWNIKNNGDIEFPNGRAFIGPSWGALPDNFNLAVIDTTPTYIVVGGTTYNSGVAGGIAFTEGWNSLGPCGFMLNVDGNAFGGTGLILTGGCPTQSDTIFEASRGGEIIFRDVVKIHHNIGGNFENTADADLHINMREFANTTTTSTNRRRGIAIRHRSSSTRQWNIATRDNNNLEFFYNGTLRGTFSSTNGVYTSSSDRKLKKDIVSMPSILSKVNSLDVYSYRFKWQTEDEKQRSIGFMAQDVRELFPELVYESTFDDGEESWLQMDYAGMSVIAIKAIQEQQSVIENYKTEMTQQKQRIEELESQLSEIKTLLLNLNK